MMNWCFTCLNIAGFTPSGNNLQHVHIPNMVQLMLMYNNILITSVHNALQLWTYKLRRTRKGSHSRHGSSDRDQANEKDEPNKGRSESYLNVELTDVKCIGRRDLWLSDIMTGKLPEGLRVSNVNFEILSKGALINYQEVGWEGRGF